MDSQDRSFTCIVAFTDGYPLECDVAADTAKRAAELAAESCASETDNDAGVKVIDGKTGEVAFFDVNITAIVKAEARPVSGAQQVRRLAQLDERTRCGAELADES